MALQINLQDILVRYSKVKVIDNFSYQFNATDSYAILGANGSGKSTLIKVISGLQSPTDGVVQYQIDGKEISQDAVFNFVSVAAPWSNVIEEFSLEECLKFYFGFRNAIEDKSVAEMIEISGLSKAKNKYIQEYSSGMKQRVRLLLAIMTDSPILLLDEPTSNLDAKGKKWYADLIEEYAQQRLIVVASNHLKDEYSFCTREIEL